MNPKMSLSTKLRSIPDEFRGWRDFSLNPELFYLGI